MLTMFVCSVFFSQLAAAQTQTISGTVTSTEDGSPLFGVSVVVQGTTKGTQTDFDGKYSIDVANGAILEFSYLGFATKTIAVAGANTIDVQLSPSVESLNEVVVTALGIRKEAKKLGYSIQTIKGEDMSQVRNTDISSTISGRVTGVQINQNGSGVGGSSSITIRGISSLVAGQNQPLIVVDGVILDNGSLGQGGFSGGIDYGNALADINPDDVSSVNILKGGNATALYGYRGANGVVVITTKKGQSGKMTIDVSSSATIDNVTIAPKFQNQYGQGYYDAPTSSLVYDITRSGSWGPALDGSQRQRFDGVGTAAYAAQSGDFKDFYRTGSTLINSIGISGGADKYTYRLSYTNLLNSPVLDGSEYKRNTVSLNTQANVTDRLRLNAKISYVQNDADNRADITDGQANTVRALLLKPRNISNADLSNYKKADGTPNNIGGGAFTMNPYYATNTHLNEDAKKRFTGLLSANYKITDNLDVTARYSQDQSNYNAKLYRPIGAFDIAPTGRMTVINQESVVSNYDLIMGYKKSLSEKIQLDATVGYSGVNNSTESTRIQANGHLDPNLFSINNYATKSASSQFFESKSQSLYGAVQFGINNNIFVEITGRNDWSSTLPKQNQSFFYPSIGTSFLLHDIFDLQSDAINMLKLRASWAKTGNATQPYQTMAVYTVSSEPYNDLSLFFLGGAEDGAAGGVVIPNADLVAELSTEYEIGLDAKFFNNRLGVDFSYYNKETSDQILQISLPPSLGAESKVINAGLVSNKGFELGLSGTPFKTKDWNWDIFVNYTKNENRIEELVEGLPSVILARQFNDVIQLVATEGELYGDLVGSSFARNEAGQLQYDEDGLPIVGENKVIGNVTPDFLMGISNSITYKNFNLGFLIDIKSGGDVFSFTDRALATQGTGQSTLEGRAYYSGGNGILVPNDVEVTAPLKPVVASRGADPAVYNGRLGQISENWVTDGSFVKLRQLSLSYNLPAVWLQKWGIQKATIGYIGRNLAILHKNTENFDPEVGFNTAIQGIEFFDLPATSSHGLKLSVSF